MSCHRQNNLSILLLLETSEFSVSGTNESHTHRENIQCDSLLIWSFTHLIFKLKEEFKLPYTKYLPLYYIGGFILKEHMLPQVVDTGIALQGFIYNQVLQLFIFLI